MIYWQYVNVGLKPVDMYEEYLQKAEACAAKIFQLNPESSKGYSLRGSVLNNRAQPAAAIRDFKRAVALDPNNPEALLWLGYCYAVSGRETLAPSWSIVSCSRPITRSRLFLVWIALMQVLYDEALRWMHARRRWTPESVEPQIFACAARTSARRACVILGKWRTMRRDGLGRLALAMNHALRANVRRSCCAFHAGAQTRCALDSCFVVVRVLSPSMRETLTRFPGARPSTSDSSTSVLSKHDPFWSTCAASPGSVRWSG